MMPPISRKTTLLKSISHFALCYRVFSEGTHFGGGAIVFQLAAVSE
jgi:hypothetical protein